MGAVKTLGFRRRANRASNKKPKAPLSPQSLFRPACAGCPASRQTIRTAPGNLPLTQRNLTLRQVRPKPKTAGLSPQSAFLAAMLQKGHERNHSALFCRSSYASKILACRRNIGAQKTTQSSFGPRRRPTPPQRHKKAPELSLRGRDLQPDCAFDQNERTTWMRPLKPSALFWKAPPPAVDQYSGVS